MKLKNFLLATILMIAAFSLAACDGINITVKFHSNGGNNIKNVVKEQGSIIEEPEVTRAGYTFLGWFESSDFDEATKVDFTEPVNRNLTIYAKWQINSYQITFEPNNGEEISSFELE
ncbi:MAG: InlB B-repeat-containing protein [Acholeplasmataceae bacterium]|nr:InlB B-repeat-containing protein [Acholeplasmataceae bacterium]